MALLCERCGGVIPDIGKHKCFQSEVNIRLFNNPIPLEYNNWRVSVNNQAKDNLTPSQVDKELKQLIAKRIEIATTKTKSDDPIVQIAWLAQGIDLYHRSDGKRGHSPEKAMEYIISSITRHIAENYLSKQEVLAAIPKKKDITLQTHQTVRGSLEILTKQHEEVGYNQAIDDITEGLGLDK